MKYTDVDILKGKIKNNKNYADMILEMKNDTDDFFANFHDDPSHNSGWGHRYFCEKDGGRLVYNWKTPDKHICEICGTVYTGKKFDDIGVYNYRNEVALSVWKSATLYKVLGEKKYLDNIIESVSFYSDNYLEFPIHNKEEKTFPNYKVMEWGCGRIMPQGLNESIFIIRIINGLQIVKEDLPKEFLDKTHKWFKEIFALLKPQVNKVHNIICWYNCAIGTMGFFSNDKDMIDFVINGKYKISKQVLEGVTKDGFWYEGSIHYNFFTLEGIVNLLLFSRLYDNPLLKEEEIVRNMLVAAYEYAFDNHTLPNPNDGWPNINLKTYSYVYTVATKVFGYDSNIANLLKNIENKKVVRGQLPLSRPYYFNNDIPLERLVLTPDLDFKKYDIVQAKSHNFTESQFAIIRNKKVNVFLKYGHRGPSHAHPDKMTIEVLIGDKLLTRDLSNSGYGAKLCDEWHRATSAHNTVVFNGANQISMSNGQTVSFTDTSVSAKVDNVYTISQDVDINTLLVTINEDEQVRYIVKNLAMTALEAEKAIKDKVDFKKLIDDKIKTMPKVDYQRDIKLTTDGFIDEFTVKTNTKGILDYFFHSEAKLTSKLELTNASLGFNDNGYQHISNVKKVITKDSVITLEWLLGDIKLTSQIDLTDKELFIAETLDNPITNHRTSLILRSKNSDVLYKIIWKALEG